MRFGLTNGLGQLKWYRTYKGGGEIKSGGIRVRNDNFIRVLTMVKEIRVKTKKNDVTIVRYDRMYFEIVQCRRKFGGVTERFRCPISDLKIRITHYKKYKTGNVKKSCNRG